jgi:murein DD-endopeptidase MepM/ murein hydrolase activator NlpD
LDLGFIEMTDSTLISPLNQVPTSILTSSGSQLENKIHAAQSASGAKRKDELKKVAQEFEAVFIAHLLKVMRETIEESGLLEGGFGKSTYTEMFDQEVSLSLAKRGALGISDLLYNNLSAKMEEEETQKTDPSSAPDPADISSTPSSPPSQIQDASNSQEYEITDLQLPVHASISSAFGMRKDPYSHQARFHKGLDLAAPEGMKVAPALSGTVVSAGYENGYGNTVVIQHSQGLQTRYGHLGSINVKAGESVTSQDILGTVGSTGRSTGPHLHFEVIRMGKAVDPLTSYHYNASATDQHLQTAKIGS